MLRVGSFSELATPSPEGLPTTQSVAQVRVSPTRSVEIEPGSTELPLRVLVVSSDPFALSLLKTSIGGAVVVHTARSDAEAVQALAAGTCDGLLLQLSRDPEEQIAWWAEVLSRLPRRPGVIALTSAPTMDVA